MKKTILFLALLFVTIGTYAASTSLFQTDIDMSDPASVVAYLTTFIVLASTFVFKKMAPAIPGWAVMMIVTGLSALVTYLTNQLGSPDLSWVAQFGLGLAATFVHQLSRQFNPSSR